MAGEPPQGWDMATLNVLRQRVMDHLQCSEEDAAERLRASMLGLLANPPNIPPPRIPTPPPEDEEPQQPQKKKVIFPDFDLDATIADKIPHHPSPYAVGKIESAEYVELWYFTTEGCKEASKATPTAADDTYGILNTDTGLTLQSIKATKASRNAIADEHLSWEQIMTARHTLITTANRVGWPDKYILSLAQFYMNLESLKSDGYNPRALILYHAVVRRQWHDTLKGRGTIFNVSRINESLYTKLENQLRDRDQEDMLKKASKTSLFRCRIETHQIP